MRHFFYINKGKRHSQLNIDVNSKKQLNHNVLFYFRFFFWFVFTGLVKWWDNPRLTTIRFKGVVDHPGNAKKTFCCLICFSNHFLLSFSPPDRRLCFRKLQKNNNQDDTFTREGDGELIASHKIQENRRLHSEDNQQFPSSFSLVFNRGLQNDLISLNDNKRWVRWVRTGGRVGGVQWRRESKSQSTNWIKRPIYYQFCVSLVSTFWVQHADIHLQINKIK